MIFGVRFKDGVQLKGSPGGVRILATFDHVAQVIGHDITVTSGNDGIHSGPGDPHFKGDALDCRTHDLPDKQAALKAMQDVAGDRFFFWIEDEGLPNEHIHGQVKRGTVYPPVEIESSIDEADA